MYGNSHDTKQRAVSAFDIRETVDDWDGVVPKFLGETYVVYIYIHTHDMHIHIYHISIICISTVYDCNVHQVLSLEYLDNDGASLGTAGSAVPGGRFVVGVVFHRKSVGKPWENAD
jgi:hypothetical protein